MPLKHSLGADHVVIAVRDLNASAARWKRLGFALSPRGAHSPQMGTANYTIVFREDYLELLGVVAATNQNKPTRNFLSMGEGIERTAFTSDDAAGGVAELKSRGVDAVGPVDFGRPVDLPGGGKGEARILRLPLAAQRSARRHAHFRVPASDARRAFRFPNSTSTPTGRSASRESRSFRPSPRPRRNISAD